MTHTLARASPHHKQDIALSGKLLRSTATVGAMTLISRIFGYARDAVIFIVLGFSGATDAFFVAFRLPNFLRRLFAEGAFSQAFVPVFSEYKTHRTQAELKTLVDYVAGTLAAALLGLTAIGIVAAPLLITVFAPGFTDNPERHALAASMLRLTFPYILFISLTALAAGILNSFGRFAVPALTPVLLNFSLIGVTLWLAPHMDQPVTALAWGVLIAGVAQLAFQLPFLARLKLLPYPKLRRRHEGVRRIAKLMLPAIFGSSVVQINLLFDTLIASFLVAGSISWLYASDRFVELPLALFGVATATVILPRLSHEHTGQSSLAFRRTLDWALRISLVVAIPAMVGLMMLAGPILATLVQYREVTPHDIRMALMSLIAYASGLPAFILIKILAPAFFARQDTLTPVRIGVIAMLANMVLNVAIVVPWVQLELPGPHAGLATATAVSAYLNAGLLYYTLRRENIYLGLAGWRALALQVLAASAAMAALVHLATPAFELWGGWPAARRVATLVGLVALGTGTYASVLWLAGARPRQFALG